MTADYAPVIHFARADALAALTRRLYEIHEGDPQVSASDIIAVVAQASADASVDFDGMARSLGNCRHCSRPVTESMTGLVHLGPKGFYANVGCRAASFVWEEEGWDETLDPKIKAAL